MIKALQPACHRTRARLIGSEAESCFRIGNQRQEEAPSAEHLGLSAGTKATKAIRWPATEGGAHRPAPGPDPRVWLIPAPESEGLTPCAALKSLSGSEDSLLRGLRKSSESCLWKGKKLCEAAGQSMSERNGSGCQQLQI